jgi:hypothetical protein
MNLLADPKGSKPSHVTRSIELLTFQESLARDRMREMQVEVADLNRARRLRAANKWQRKAELANRRARLAREALR